jgi:hypothetical protein
MTRQKTRTSTREAVRAPRDMGLATGTTVPHTRDRMQPTQLIQLRLATLSIQPHIPLPKVLPDTLRTAPLKAEATPHQQAQRRTLTSQPVSTTKHPPTPTQQDTAPALTGPAKANIAHQGLPPPPHQAATDQEAITVPAATHTSAAILVTWTRPKKSSLSAASPAGDGAEMAIMSMRRIRVMTIMTFTMANHLRPFREIYIASSVTFPQFNLRSQG